MSKSERLDVTHWQSNLVKLVAMATMLVDHIGVVFFPNVSLWRIVGRIAFPLFAYQLGVGYDHTSDTKKYALRLLLFALLSQLPYYLVRQEWMLNIFFTLLLGFGAISLYRHNKHNWLLLYLLAVTIITYVVPYDFGGYGVLIILLFYIVTTPSLLAGSVAALSLLFLTVPEGYIQMFIVLAFPVLWGIKQVRLPAQMETGLSHVNKWVFYAFYPLHLSLLWAVKTLLG